MHPFFAPLLFLFLCTVQGCLQYQVQSTEPWYHQVRQHLNQHKTLPFLICPTSSSFLTNTAIYRSSNLCTEIVQYTSPDEVAVCNLASVVLPKFVVEEEKDEGGEAEVPRKSGFGAKITAGFGGSNKGEMNGCRMDAVRSAGKD